MSVQGVGSYYNDYYPVMPNNKGKNKYRDVCTGAISGAGAGAVTASVPFITSYLLFAKNDKILRRAIGKSAVSFMLMGALIGCATGTILGAIIKMCRVDE